MKNINDIADKIKYLDAYYTKFKLSLLKRYKKSMILI